MSTWLLQRIKENRSIWSTFRHHSRTFSLAALLLPPSVQVPIATLYVFCRRVDTIADRRLLAVGPAHARRELHELQRQLDQTLRGRPGDDLLWQRLAEVQANYDLEPGPLHELIQGAQWDLDGQTIHDRNDLIDYADLVGGSVGAMLLPFLTDDGDMALQKPARQLGIAMQITNIVRDVGEDLGRLDRVYLPSRLLSRHGLTVNDLSVQADSALPETYPALLEEVMESAEARYRESFRGITRLPLPMRLGIHSAAVMYREIMNEVRANGYDNLTRRAFVPLPRKLRLLVQDDYHQRKQRLRTAQAPAAV